jgi:hypothetical protein
MSGSIANSSENTLSIVECINKEHHTLVKTILNTHHSYVGYKHSPNQRTSFLVYENTSGNLIGVMGLCNATLAINCRDAYIGWHNNAQKMKWVKSIANNNRFCLIRENITVKNAASRALKLLRTEGVSIWNKKYDTSLIMLETFVQPLTTDTIHRVGTCYKADNWIHVGNTKGYSIKKIPLSLWKKENTERGKLARENPKECCIIYSKYANNTELYGYDIQDSVPKIVYIYPLIKDWKETFLSS